ELLLSDGFPPHSYHLLAAAAKGEELVADRYAVLAGAQAVRARAQANFLCPGAGEDKILAVDVHLDLGIIDLDHEGPFRSTEARDRSRRIDPARDAGGLSDAERDREHDHRGDEPAAKRPGVACFCGPLLPWMRVKLGSGPRKHGTRATRWRAGRRGLLELG